MCSVVMVITIVMVVMSVMMIELVIMMMNMFISDGDKECNADDECVNDDECDDGDDCVNNAYGDDKCWCNDSAVVLTFGARGPRFETRHARFLSFIYFHFIPFQLFQSVNISLSNVVELRNGLHLEVGLKEIFPTGAPGKMYRNLNCTDHYDVAQKKVKSVTDHQ